MTSVRKNASSRSGHVPPKPDLSWTHKPLKSGLRRYLWRWRVWVEATFVLSMLEPWEKIMLIIFFTLLNLLLIAGIVIYLPAHLSNMHGRAVYYLWGGEDTMTSILPASAENVSMWGY